MGAPPPANALVTASPIRDSAEGYTPLAMRRSTSAAKTDAARRGMRTCIGFVVRASAASCSDLSTQSFGIGIDRRDLARHQGAPYFNGLESYTPPLKWRFVKATPVGYKLDLNHCDPGSGTLIDLDLQMSILAAASPGGKRDFGGHDRLPPSQRSTSRPWRGHRLRPPRPTGSNLPDRS